MVGDTHHVQGLFVESVNAGVVEHCGLFGLEAEDSALRAATPLCMAKWVLLKISMFRTANHHFSLAGDVVHFAVIVLVAVKFPGVLDELLQSLTAGIRRNISPASGAANALSQVGVGLLFELTVVGADNGHVVFHRSVNYLAVVITVVMNLLAPGDKFFTVHTLDIATAGTAVAIQMAARCLVEYTMLRAANADFIVITHVLRGGIVIATPMNLYM